MRHLVLFPLVLMAVLPVGGAAQTLPASRAFEPVVVTGAALEPLEGATPERVAAFRYEDSVWVPVPVQVDEREEIDLAWVYNGRNNVRCQTAPWCYERGPVYENVYMDEGTYVGRDANPFVDGDDEVVFMAQDAGARAPADATAPPGVRGSDGVEVAVEVPGSAEKGYVYLFWNDGRYPGDAGRPYVEYRFRLLSGDYHDTYNLRGVPFTTNRPVGDALGANPEDTEVVTAFYRRHFSDRWIEDELMVRSGEATGADLLDRRKLQYGPSDCRRTEYTGSSGRGAIIASRGGPIRAIRSVIGFNSGPFVQQDLRFYERYAHTSFILRVHPVDGGLDLLDYSDAAVGMRRYTNLSPDGLLVDGEPEHAENGPLEWEVLQGVQGTVVTAYGLSTDIPDFQRGSYYTDEAPAREKQCTGDESAYGASGPWFLSEIPNTDPLRDTAYHLSYDRHQLYESPTLPLDSAHAFIAATRSPLVVQTRLYPVRLGDDPDPPPGSELGPDDPVFLEPPRPNPSAGLARITYWIEEETDVKLAVYDLVGRRVAVLDEGRRTEGYHDVGIRPGRFPSGTYLIRLETPLGERTVTFVRQ